MHVPTRLCFDFRSVFKGTISFVLTESNDLNIVLGQVIVDKFLIGDLFAGRFRLEHVVAKNRSKQSSCNPLLVVRLIGSTTSAPYPQILGLRVKRLFFRLIILSRLFIVLFRVTLLSLFFFVFLLWLFILSFWGIILALA